MKTVAKIIETCGGLERLRNNYIRLENPPYMRLVIEYVGTGPRGTPVAHYYEQNGDLMCDPEMVFEVNAEDWYKSDSPQPLSTPSAGKWTSCSTSTPSSARLDQAAEVAAVAVRLRKSNLAVLGAQPQPALDTAEHHSCRPPCVLSRRPPETHHA